MKTITIVSQKGGAGKTTTAAALAQAAATKGKRVLAIDLDPQGNLTYSAAARTDTATAEDVLQGRISAEEAAQHSQCGFDIIPASWSLQTEKTEKGSATRLKRALETVRGKYDLIIIDTQASPGELQYNALYAASDLIIPLQADAYSVQALYQTIGTAERIRQYKSISIIITCYDGRSTLAKTLHEEITKAAAVAGLKVLGTVRKGVAIQEAAAVQANIYEYAPKSKPAQDYMTALERFI